MVKSILVKGRASRKFLESPRPSLGGNPSPLPFGHSTRLNKGTGGWGIYIYISI